MTEEERKKNRVFWLQKINLLKTAITRGKSLPGFDVPTREKHHRYACKLQMQIRYKKHKLTKIEMEELNELWNMYKS